MTMVIETKRQETTGITECIYHMFLSVKSVRPVDHFLKTDAIAARASIPYDGFYDAIKGELERIYAVSDRGKYAYLELE